MFLVIAVILVRPAYLSNPVKIQKSRSAKKSSLETSQLVAVCINKAGHLRAKEILDMQKKGLQKLARREHHKGLSKWKIFNE
jgi:hypothetical protein